MTDAASEYFRLIDLSSVPVPDFVEALDYEAIRQAAINDLLQIDPEYSAILESDPAIKVIEVFAYRELILRQRVNDAMRQTTITDAVGSNLDVAAAFFNTKRFDNEGDEQLRRRSQLGIYIAAVGGPLKAYEFQALSAHPNVVDVSIHSPAPGEIAVTVLAYEDVAAEKASPEQLLIGKSLFAQPRDKAIVRILAGASSDVMKTVRTALNEKALRPMTDGVTVQPPTPRLFSVDAKLVVYPGPDAETVRRASIASLSSYLQSIRKVAYDATLAGLIASLKVGGVQNVILAAPAQDITASFYDLAVCTSAKVTVERVDV
ncbi:baseplate assembly protein [Brucella intermedia]|uniref:baseplate assembly protein n=1 Tax=Brucella intermedia TaxID=94625 RepID=UPI00235E38BB|nr:baseplate J/gp47 family protein [Brucella intermedia]